MTIVIYGRDNCSYCKRAVELAKQLKGHGYGDYEYIDITTAGIDKEKLSEIVGKPVETIPQVLIDGQPIGGYTETGCIRQHPLILTAHRSRFLFPPNSHLFPLKFKKQHLNDSIPTMYGIISENELLLLLIL